MNKEASDTLAIGQLETTWYFGEEAAYAIDSDLQGIKTSSTLLNVFSQVGAFFFNFASAEIQAHDCKKSSIKSIGWEVF